MGHASANAAQSMSSPLRSPKRSPSRMTELRQSTTVPNTSNVNALIVIFDLYCTAPTALFNAGISSRANNSMLYTQLSLSSQS